MDSIDSRLGRLRHEALVTAVDNLPSDTGGTVSFLGTTTTINTYPVTAQAFYAMLNTDADGVEEEGESVSFTTSDDEPVMAFNLGSTVPPEGSRTIVDGAGGIFTFTWNS